MKTSLESKQMNSLFDYYTINSKSNIRAKTKSPRPLSSRITPRINHERKSNTKLNKIFTYNNNKSDYEIKNFEESRMTSKLNSFRKLTKGTNTNFIQNFNTIGRPKTSQKIRKPLPVKDEKLKTTIKY